MTDDDFNEEQEDALVFTCGNCHNMLRTEPPEAEDQLLDAEDMVLCNCGAPVLSGGWFATEWAA